MTITPYASSTATDGQPVVNSTMKAIIGERINSEEKTTASFLFLDKKLCNKNGVIDNHVWMKNHDETKVCGLVPLG